MLLMVVYRYKFTPEFMVELESFSKIHKYDLRPVYKEEWGKWKKNNKLLIDNETRYMEELGYKGNIEDKMYKAGRYYFRTKTDLKQKQKKRTEYIQLGLEFIEMIDRNIQENRKDKHFSPAIGYNQFLETSKVMIQNEFDMITEIIKEEDFYHKLKKMYKNRHYIIMKSNK